MNNRALFSSVVVALMSAGCAAQPVPLSVSDEAAAAQAVVCTSGPCQVWIDVVDCSTDKITATPNLYVPPPTKPSDPRYTPKIKWHINTRGYSFRDDGIRFKSLAGQSQFDGQNPNPGSVDYEMLNKNTQAGSYDYWIYIQGPGGQRCKHDPFVFNG
jgi:hypothetical protein